jgi:hypothetical protein
VAGVIVRTRVRLYAVGVRLRTEEYMSDFPIFFTGHCDSEFVLEKTSVQFIRQAKKDHWSQTPRKFVCVGVFLKPYVGHPPHLLPAPHAPNTRGGARARAAHSHVNWCFFSRETSARVSSFPRPIMLSGHTFHGLRPAHHLSFPSVARMSRRPRTAPPSPRRSSCSPCSPPRPSPRAHFSSVSPLPALDHRAHLRAAARARRSLCSLCSL